jgi:putative SOS response-associated peptidase YedK
MCGYIGNLHQSPAVIDLFNQLQLPLPYPQGQHYMMRTCDGHIAASYGLAFGPAVWWYALRREGDSWVPNADITSFNARNLNSRLWREAINKRRGLVIATEIGETQSGVHYLMKALTPLAIGTVFQDYPTDAEPMRGFALITRPAHPRFAAYHEKAMPLFLPLDSELLKTWLDPAVSSEHPTITALLENPRITTDLEVTPVKTFKRGEPVGDTEILLADPPSSS